METSHSNNCKNHYQVVKKYVDGVLSIYDLQDEQIRGNVPPGRRHQARDVFLHLKRISPALMTCQFIADYFDLRFSMVRNIINFYGPDGIQRKNYINKKKRKNKN